VKNNAQNLNISKSELKKKLKLETLSEEEYRDIEQSLVNLATVFFNLVKEGKI
jgi:hypothetical protein